MKTFFERVAEAQRVFFTGVMFLTRVPACHLADHDPQFLARSTAIWPLLGALLGLAAGMVFAVARLWEFPPLLAACGALATTAILTGCFHEDAFADVCDGFGGYTPQKRLEIMRDSRVGAFGVVGLILLSAAKLALISACSPWIGVAALVTGHALGRWSSVLLVWRVPYVADAASLAKPLAASVAPATFASATLWAASSALLALHYGLNWGWLPALGGVMALGMGVALLSWGAARFFRPWIGGLSGDALGATNQLCELACYALIFQLSRLGGNLL